jgi:preprotein translocase subunit Sec63
MHHPDKVAGMRPETREYSEERMKEINAAYAELRRRGA